MEEIPMLILASPAPFLSLALSSVSLFLTLGVSLNYRSGYVFSFKRPMTDVARRRTFSALNGMSNHRESITQQVNIFL